MVSCINNPNINRISSLLLSFMGKYTCIRLQVFYRIIATTYILTKIALLHTCFPLGTPPGYSYVVFFYVKHIFCIQGSKLAQTKLDMECIDKDGCLKQDRYSLRTAAQWLGPAMDLIHRAIKNITININSTNDNPIIDHLNENILHGGNFQVKYEIYLQYLLIICNLFCYFYSLQSFIS